MTFGRALSFTVILAVSLGLSSILVRRHPRRALSPPSRSAPSRFAPVPARPLASVAAPRAPAEQAPEVIEDPLSSAVCPDGMLLVEGVTCAEGARHCLERGAEPSAACRRFEPAKCRRGLPLRFCIDRFEYPNREGMLPAAVVTFEQARSACAEEGKRLCREIEWSFACEGPKGLAFSYGDEMDAAACNVGHPAPHLAADALWEPRDVAAIMEREDARAASGALHGCVGPFGTRDLIGNVEEWVRSDVPGFERALHGGGDTGAPSCAAVRQIKQPSFRQLDTGFRCCRDPFREPRRAENDAARPSRTVAPRRGFD